MEAILLSFLINHALIRFRKHTVLGNESKGYLAQGNNTDFYRLRTHARLKNHRLDLSSMMCLPLCHAQAI